MSSSNLIPRSLVAAAALSALCGGLQASEQVCSNAEIVLQPTNWNDSSSIVRFDPALGILTGIDFVLAGTAQGSSAIESLDAAPSVVSTAFLATITLTRPDNSVLVVTTPLASFTDALTAFDGTIDFGGTSGITHAGIVANDSDAASSPPPASDLLLFTGSPGNPGTITLPIGATGSSTASGSGNLITQFQTAAGALVSVCYTYELDCNANGVPDSDDIALGTSPDLGGDGIPDECQPLITSFCEGDGSFNGGADCPCDNNGAPGEGCDNGTGSGGLLSATGVPSVSNDTVEITASQIPPHHPGLFFFSTQPSNGGNGVVFNNGLRCIDFATPVLKVDGGGTIPMPGAPSLSDLLNIHAGDTTYFQYWYRNPEAPCGNGSANATNGLQITWGL